MSGLDNSARASRKKRLPASLNSGLDRKLLSYAAAASAAGVAAVSLAQPCQAEIIYTKTKQYITGFYALDLNHDGITDFTIYNQVGSCSLGAPPCNSFTISVRGIGTNQVWDYYGSIGLGPSARNLNFGQIIGPGVNFRGSGFMGKCRATRSSYYLEGQWDFARYNDLGFSFSINGQIHYGWARLNTNTKPRRCGDTVLLTGYAYETIPGKSIEAGRQTGKDVDNNDADESPAALGGLALGRSQSGHSETKGSEK